MGIFFSKIKNRNRQQMLSLTRSHVESHVIMKFQ